MADADRTPTDPREPLLLRGRASVWGAPAASPAGGGGAGRFTCRLPHGSSPWADAYHRSPGPLAARERGGFSEWWDEWWGGVEAQGREIRAELADKRERAGQVYEAVELAFGKGYINEAIALETGVMADAALAGVVPVLRDVALKLVGFTLGGAVLFGAVSGGAAVAPGVALGFKAGLLYLSVEGIDEVIEHVAANLAEIRTHLEAGAGRAWNAGRFGGPKSSDIEAAARSFARAGGVIFRLILEALVVVLVARGAARVTQALRASRLGPGFADWVGRNAEKLRANPKLRPKGTAQGGGGGGAGAGGGGAGAGGGAASQTTPRSTAAKPPPTKAAAEGPPINRQKQDGHIKGTPQHANRVKSGKYTSTFDDPAAADQLTREAWEKGSPVKGHPESREFDFGRRVGTSPGGDAETKVRVSIDKQGKIHGHTRR